jgi:hypothetical protein
MPEFRERASSTPRGTSMGPAPDVGARGMLAEISQRRVSLETPAGSNLESVFRAYSSAVLKWSYLYTSAF